MVHDRAYHRGGSRAQRRAADARLLACVAARGHPAIAVVMWVAVRVGGHPLWPFSWRWGFGHPWGRSYQRQR